MKPANQIYNPISSTPTLLEAGQIFGKNVTTGFAAASDLAASLLESCIKSSPLTICSLVECDAAERTLQSARLREGSFVYAHNLDNERKTPLYPRSGVQLGGVTRVTHFAKSQHGLEYMSLLWGTQG